MTGDPNRAGFPAWILVPIAVLIGFGAYLQWQMQRSGRELALLRAQLAAELERSQSTASEPYRQGLAIVASRDTYKVLLASKNFEPRITVYWNHDKGLLLVANGLPPLSPKRTLELWVSPPDDAPPVPLGTFRPDRDGKLFAVFPPKSALDDATALIVNEEPAGGSAQPTSPIAWITLLERDQ